MQLLVVTAIIFFGTLLAAALVALGEPASITPSLQQQSMYAGAALQPEGGVRQEPSASHSGR